MRFFVLNRRIGFVALSFLNVASIGIAAEPVEVQRHQHNRLDAGSRQELRHRIRSIDRNTANTVVDELRPAGAAKPQQSFSFPVDGAPPNIAGETHPFGDIVYQNNSSTYLLPVSFGERVADDIETTCLSSDMVFLVITTSGGGDGTGPGYSFTTQLWDRCPSGGGVPIAGTLRTVELLNDGAWSTLLSFADAPVHLSRSFWISLEFSTASAGVYIGDEATIGHSNDVIDQLFPCSTTFGQCDTGGPCANFALTVYAVNCSPSFVAYKATSFSAFFVGLNGDEIFADDIVPTTAPTGLCDLASYEPGMAGLGLPFCAFTEIWSNDEANLRPLAPVPGTQTDYCMGGEGTFDPPVTITTPVFWMVYQIEGDDAGPILVGDFPEIGFSEDCFAMYGEPDPDVFSFCMWFFGGCPMWQTGNPCGTFMNTIVCAGEEPRGACCDPAIYPEGYCRDEVPVSQCHGRFEYLSLCANANFDPECGIAACCAPIPDDPFGNTSCMELKEDECSDLHGEWHPGTFCHSSNVDCPTPSICLTSDNDCFTSSPDNDGGCNIPGCCSMVCDVDPFCCVVAWDEVCAGEALILCVSFMPVPDECVEAIEVTCNESVTIDNRGATDVSSDPGFGCHVGGSGQNGIGSVWAKFVATTSNARLTTCNSESPADDSLLAVYSGSCGNLVEIGCNDDTLGCAITDFNSDVTVHNLVAGTTYYVQLASWTEVDRGFYELNLTCTSNCPAGPVTFVDPPSGVVDARQTRPVNQPGPSQGIQTFVVQAPIGADPECFRHCQAESFPVQDNSIESVVSNGSGQYVITLERPMPPHAVTRIAYDPQGGDPTVGTFISHPGNVNGDSMSATTDILALIDCLNGVNLSTNCPWGIYSTDIDRSGQFNPADILRLIDMLNGTDGCEWVPCPPVPSTLPNGECEP